MISLQPRYRRLLTVGALLDESISLFRAHWLTLALFSLVSFVPLWLLLVAGNFSGYRQAFARPTVNSITPADWLAFFGVTLAQTLLGFLWSAASTAAAAYFLGGQRPTVWQVYRLALRRLPTIVLTTLLLFLLFLLLFLASTALFVVTLFGTLGTLIALIGLIYWWAKPAGRRGWLKWLIILTTPYGLAAYYFVRWSLYVPAVVLEGRGAVGGLRRSSQLVEHQWFRAGAVLTLATLILIVLVSVPVLVMDFVFAVIGFGNVFTTTDTTGPVISNTVTIVVQTLFSSIGTVAYLLLFVDLRNRQEGTDIGERISTMEAATA